MNVANNIPNGWVKTTLGEVSEIIMGQSPKGDTCNENGTGLPLLNGPTEFGVTSPIPVQFTTAPKKISKINDLLFCVRGSTTGRMNWSNQQYVIGRGLASVRHKEGVEFRKYIKGILDYKLQGLLAEATGSTFPNISKNQLENIEINLPSLPEQKAIAAVLTSFDDKIELLQAQNKTLETTAQTIFKEWFGKYQIGDEFPDGWRVGKIGDLTEIKRGGSPRPIKEFISDCGYRWLKISDATATSSPYIFDIKEHIKVEGLRKTILKKKGDIVLSNSATPGMPKFLAVDTCVHDGWMHFPSSKVSNEYLYLLFLDIRPKLVQQGSGSVFVNLKTDILRFYETLIPSESVMKNFDELVKPIFNKIFNNATQIQTLKQARDTLLPKLMSGKLRVNDFKENEV